MGNGFRRHLIAAVSLGMALAGAAAIFLPRVTETSAAGKTYTVAIISTGFNPELCIIRMDDFVQWINKDTVPHQIVGDVNPNLDTGVLQPGETSRRVGINSRSKIPYHDKLNPSLKGTLSFGLNPASCKEAPPTPTPTNTPTITPTFTPAPPTATPTPTPIPTPDFRRSYSIYIAKDEDN